MVKGFKIPRRTVGMTFTGDYEGAEIEAQLDVSIGMFLDIQELVSGDKALEVFGAFGDSALISWNLLDDDGNPLPANGDGMRALPTAMGNLIIEQWMEAVANTPAPLGRPSRNGNTSEGASTVAVMP